MIGCYNEKDTILEAIKEAKELKVDKEIIIIDNNSTDGTKEILNQIKDDSLQIILQPKNYGPGRSSKLAISLAKGDYSFFPGADLEYKMSDVYRMITVMEENNLDVVFGSRLLAKKHISKLQLIKERPQWLATIVTTYLANKWYNKKLTDIIGISLYRTNILKNLKLKEDGHALTFELVSFICKKGYKISEIPVYYKPRSKEEGKTIKWWDMISAIIAMIRVKLSG